MTLILSAVSKCAVCGQTVKHKLLASTNAFGSPDLDFRPPEMQRSTMPHWATRCPHCGYVAGEIDKKISARERKRITAILNSREYQTCDSLNLPDETARKFYQQYLLYRDVKRDDTLFSYLQNCIWQFLSCACEKSSSKSDSIPGDGNQERESCPCTGRNDSGTGGFLSKSR